MSGDHDNANDVRTQLISVAIGVVARFLFSFAGKGVELAIKAFQRRHTEAPKPTNSDPLTPPAGGAVFDDDRDG